MTSSVDWKIDGVYDDRTMRALSEIGTRHIGFDFRPLSLNFIQNHIFQDLIFRYFNSNSKYYLRFENEKDFVVQSFLDSISERFGEKTLINNFVLEFSGDMPKEYYQTFKVPFIWHYDEGNSWQELMGLDNLKGIVLDIKILEYLHVQGRLHSFVQVLYQLIQSHKRFDLLDLILKINWDSHIIPSLFEFFDLGIISLGIGPEVEECYRNVDLTRMTKQYHLFKSNLNNLQQG
ncbi:MAG: hypothetical protein HOE90_10970 [Bacteriovoracaceae bacterium]|jgi:hypothetical protein|nr:hypothetical protein [Bacteriovoracaceae bacterium]